MTLKRSDRTKEFVRSPSPVRTQNGASASLYRDRVRSPPGGGKDMPPPPPADQQQQQPLSLDAASIKALAAQIWEFLKPAMEQDMKPIAEMADKALVTAKAAESRAEQLQQQMHSDKYSSGHVMSRKKRLAMSPLRLDLGQDRSPKARRAAGRRAVEGVLAAFVKGEMWDVFDVEVYPCKGREHRDRYVVVFSVQRTEEARLIWEHKSTLKQQQQRVSVYVDLTPQEMANKSQVMAHPAFKEAAAKVLAKPKGTPGFTMGWDLDRGFTVVDGVRTNWHADSLPPAGGQQAGEAMEAEQA